MNLHQEAMKKYLRKVLHRCSNHMKDVMKMMLVVAMAGPPQCLSHGLTDIE